MSSINDAIERARIIGDLHSKITALEQERDRLREVLGQIATDLAIGAPIMRHLAQCSLAKHAEITKS